MNSINVLVGGPGGYAGEQAVDRLSHHPNVGQVLPIGREMPDESVLKVAQAAILAMPHGISGGYAAQLDEAGIWVADLSGDLRLETVGEYEQWYPDEHPAPELMQPKRSVPCVIPELDPGQVPREGIVSITGCYSSASLLGMLPLIRAGLIEPGETVRINAISGVSGYGKERKAKADEIIAAREVKTYKPGRTHQHVPEMEQFLDGRKVFFSPAVGPYFRGIVAKIDMKLTKTAYDHNAQAVLEEAYADEPHIVVHELGSDLPTVTDSVGTDTCHIGLIADNRELQVVSSIDNLGRGAAAGGIRAMNQAFGFEKSAGLLLEPRDSDLTSDTMAP